MDPPEQIDGALERLNLSEESPKVLTGDSPKLPIAGVFEERTTRMGRLERAESNTDSNGSNSDVHTELKTLRPTAAENFRNWETNMRKRELQRSSPRPEDLQHDYRFWELKLRKGELDHVLQKSKQTWLLDKVAEIPETLHLGTSRTFWEVKATD